MQISEAEHAARADAFAGQLRERSLAGAVLFDAGRILYYTGFAFVPTERPIALVVASGGGRGLLVPRLEREHAAANAVVDEVADYPEYPAAEHPLRSLPSLLERLDVSDDALGADSDGYPWILGYRGPTVAELTGSPPAPIAGLVEDQMAVKSAAEIELLRESSK